MFLGLGVRGRKPVGEVPLPGRKWQRGRGEARKPSLKPLAAPYPPPSWPLPWIQRAPGCAVHLWEGQGARAWEAAWLPLVQRPRLGWP